MVGLEGRGQMMLLTFLSLCLVEAGVATLLWIIHKTWGLR